MDEKADQDCERLFRSWLREHTGLIVKVASGWALSKEDRADLTQEILLQIWRTMPRFEGKAKVSTWIYRVALNTALTWRRKECKHARHVPLMEIEEPPATSPDDSLARDRELVDALYAGIRKLPKMDGALVMMYLDDLGYHEMAEILGISENLVGVKLNRARKTLAEFMKEVPRAS